MHPNTDDRKICAGPDSLPLNTFLGVFVHELIFIKTRLLEIFFPFVFTYKGGKYDSLLSTVFLSCEFNPFSPLFNVRFL